MEKNFIRAKSKENKQIRMNEIMDVTDDLFKTHTYHEITLTLIAKEMNMARGNLYKYFDTKEEIFLQIYSLKQTKAVESMMKKLNKENVTIPLLSKIIAETLEENFDYIKYHQILNAIIETNVSVNKLAEFKLKMFNENEPLYETIKETCQLSTIQQATDIYLTILYHSCYLYDRITYQDAYVQAMKLVQLPIIPLNFKKELSHFVTMCLTHYFE